MTDPHAEVAEAKRELRRTMRELRRSLVDRPERSERITEHLVALDALRNATRLLAYDAVAGEVETATLVRWCSDRDVEVAMPEDDVGAEWADVIIVPGTAFTAHGQRIGQGGGWYDRFLPGRRPDAVTIGIAFSPQLVESLPMEAHDVLVDCVVTEDGPIWPHG